MNNKTLLIIAHGSRSQAWNDAIRDFCVDIQNTHLKSTPFHRIGWCFLEHAEPSIHTALNDLLQEDEKDIYALPLFLSIGQHVANDIPEELENIARLVQNTQNSAIYEYEDAKIHFLKPLPAVDLLTDNAERRFLRFSKEKEKRGLILVYYGSKKFGHLWNELAEDVNKALTQKLPNVRIEYAYAGDAVDFSSEPLVQILNDLGEECGEIVILPELVAVGVLQNKIIPAAVEQSNKIHLVVYVRDSILPDPTLNKRIVQHAVNSIIT